MRRRITVAMVLLVLGALVVSGLVGLFLAARSATTQAERQLVREAQGLAAGVQAQAATNNPADPARAMRTLLVDLRVPLRLDGTAVIGLRRGPAGVVAFNLAAPRTRAALPAGVSLAALHPASLLALQPVSGRSSDRVFAAVPYRAPVQLRGAPRLVVQVVVLTQGAPHALAGAWPWFVWSGLAILAVAVLVAWRLGLRVVRPVQAAQAVASRIAGGDFDARVPDPPGTDPELSSLASSINSMAESLARSRVSERQFLRSVSHDLRTPLTSIRGFAEAIEDRAAPDPAAAASVIASEARRLERLVGDLLGLATIEGRRFSLDPQPVDLAASATASVAGFVPSAAEVGVTLSCDAAGAVPVVADPDRLAQVTANLIENALRYAAHEVRVSVSPAGAVGELTVADDGPGIGPGELSRAFDKLAGRQSPGRPIGSGLGLAIVAELVHAMGGEVRAESDGAANGRGGGTRMIVTLPSAVTGRPDTTLTSPSPPL